MALDTYTNLKTTVADWLNRSDLSSQVPDFITLAEAQMHRRFVGRQRQGLPIPRRLIGRSTDSTVALAAEYVAVPTDFSSPLVFELTSASPPVDLDYLEPENLRQWKASAPLTGKPPKFYTVIGGEFQIYPVADTTYTAELTYIKRFPALSGSNPTNWILTDYPDAYLYGALVQSAPYLKDDGRLTTWGTLFTAAIDDICNADPMPSDKSTLRTEFPQLTRLGRLARYDITTDN